MTPHPRRFHPPGRTAKPGPATRSVPFRATPGGTSHPFPPRPPFAAPPVPAKPLRGSADTGNPLLASQSCMDKMAARPPSMRRRVRLALPGSGIPRLFPHSRPYPPGTPPLRHDCPVRACETHPSPLGGTGLPKHADIHSMEALPFQWNGPPPVPHQRQPYAALRRPRRVSRRQRGTAQYAKT